MGKRENWVFGLAIIGAVAAVLKILEYFGISPQTKPSGGTAVPMTHPHTGLVWAIILFAFSIALSGYGFYYANRRQKAVISNVVLISAPQDDPKFEGDRAFIVGNPGESWPRKLVFGCTNKSLLRAFVFAPIWKPDQTPEDSKPHTTLLEKTSGPWNASQCFTVEPGAGIRMWIALDPSHDVKTVEGRIQTRQNGTILLPVKQSGKLFIKTFKV